jgi:hypothetical protein
MSRPATPPAQDYAEIHNLYAYYNLTSDAGDATDYADCWTDDGVLTIDQLNFRLQGRSNFIAFKQKDKAGRAGKYRRHWNGAVFLEWVDERTVRGRCYLHGLNGTPGSLPVLADAGVYEDLIVKVNGEWRFASRSITMDASQWTPPKSKD